MLSWYEDFFNFNLSSHSVSSGAVCSLTVLLSFPRCRQPLWPQGHLPGVASHPSHHSGCRVKRWRFVSVGLQRSHQDELYPRGEFLCGPNKDDFRRNTTAENVPSVCWWRIWACLRRAEPDILSGGWSSVRWIFLKSMWLLVRGDWPCRASRVTHPQCSVQLQTAATITTMFGEVTKIDAFVIVRWEFENHHFSVFEQLLVLLCWCVCEQTDVSDRRQHGTAAAAEFGRSKGHYSSINCGFFVAD